MEWVCSWLEKRTGWLLLLDNAAAEMARDIFKKLPRFGGSTILSTVIVNVYKMEKEEALSLLLGLHLDELAGQDTARLEEAREIVTALDFMPLAIILLALTRRPREQLTAII